MVHKYSDLYKIPVTGLLLFTVYGTWGRPDMTYFSLTRDILSGELINGFNYGNMKCDFIYVDDIVEQVHRFLDTIRQANPESDVRQQIS